MPPKKHPGRSNPPRRAKSRDVVPPDPPTLEQVAERMRAPTFLDALSPEERAERVPEAMETSGPAGPKRPPTRRRT